MQRRRNTLPARTQLAGVPARILLSLSQRRADEQQQLLARASRFLFPASQSSERRPVFLTSTSQHTGRLPCSLLATAASSPGRGGFISPPPQSGVRVGFLRPGSDCLLYSSRNRRLSGHHAGGSFSSGLMKCRALRLPTLLRRRLRGPAFSRLAAW